MWAFFNDFMQRIITLNKLEQRKNLLETVQSLNLPQKSKVLDFGCGTALFTKVFTKLGLNYYGYDIDKRLISYACRLYRNGRFVASKAELKKEGPYDLIIANCCFHHIDDIRISKELCEMKKILNNNGTFIMIDILLAGGDPSSLRKIYRKLERGAYIRSSKDYQRLVEEHFTIRKSGVEYSHLFSLKCIPVWNRLVFFVCEISEKPLILINE